jgi:hypothetical protein
LLLFPQSTMPIFLNIHYFFQGFNCPFVHWCGVEIQFGLLAFCGCAMGGTFYCWLVEQSISSPMKYIQYHDWMLHLGLNLQLVDGDYSKLVWTTHLNLLYTSQKFKKLVKFGYVRIAWFWNNYFKEINLKKPSKSSHTKCLKLICKL